MPRPAATHPLGAGVVGGNAAERHAVRFFVRVQDVGRFVARVIDEGACNEKEKIWIFNGFNGFFLLEILEKK